MFLSALIPNEGYICVAMLLKNGAFRHFFYRTIEEAQLQINVLEKSGHTVYVAQATFATEENRKQANAAYLKNFFFDIDCGEGKDYPDQKQAASALKQFVTDTGLPFPTIVSSGNGLYAHWILDRAIPAMQWKTVARLLKNTAVAYEFRTDPARTSDSASVLRPPGTTNRKPGKDAKPVSLLTQAREIDFNDFVSRLNKAARKKKVTVTETAPPQEMDINADAMEGLDGRAPSSIVLVADKCRQIANFRDLQGAVSEPYWYAALGVMVHCDDGNSFVQAWSSGHPDYSSTATNKKAEQYLASGAGPTTCVKFGTETPDLCVGCPHNGQIKSPIVLGRPEPEALVIEDELKESVSGFRRSDEGLFWDQDGRWVRFYDQDLYVDRVAYDSSLGYQVMVIKHTLPHEGVLEFVIRSSLIHDQRALMIALSDNNVHVVGVKEKKIMTIYIEGHLAKLARAQKMTRLLSQMGWAKVGDRKLFVLGKKMFYSDGTVEEAALAKNVPESAKGFRSEGDPNKWTEATAMLGLPHMEPFAFALLCGFAAPLMKFTGFDGALVSLVGESGVGKTLMLRWVQSIYGHHNELMMLRDDTKNALVSRLGVYGNLPLAVDEVTNADGQELSDFVYRITQGRDKARLTKNSEEKKNLNPWNTLALVSTNSSLTDKLSGAKFDASAELNRVFEYYVPHVESFSGRAATDLYWTLHENFGHAGEKFVSYLAQNLDTLPFALRKMQDKVDKDISVQGEERFWAAIVAAAAYAGVVAKKLGLIKFDVARVLAWAEAKISGMRADKMDLSEDAVGILAQFIDTHSANRLVVRGNTVGKRECVCIEAPRGALIMRHEMDYDRLYIARSVFKQWISKRYGSYSKVRDDLKHIGALKNANKSKSLGAGTVYAGAAQPCWEVDLKVQKLGAVGLQLVVKAETIARLKEQEIKV